MSVRSTVISLTSILIATSFFHCQAADLSGNARIQVCKPKSVSHPNESQIVSFPVGAKFVIPADKSGTGKDILVSQNNFQNSTSGEVKPLAKFPEGYSIDFQQKNGVSIANIDLSGKECIYLDAAPIELTPKDATLSGTMLRPEWLSKTELNGEHATFQYFTSFEPTYYVGSEVGKNLQYVVHGMQTGSHLSSNRVNNVPVVNSLLKRSFASALKRELNNINQLDINVVDLADVQGKLTTSDIEDSGSLSAFVAKFKSALPTQPHARLIVALPMRAPIKLAFSNGTFFGGKVDGMGFYVDPDLETKSDETNGASGFLEVFLNCRAYVIDLDSGKILAQRDYVGAYNFTAALSPNGSVVDTINDTEKFRALMTIVSDGASKLVSDLFVSH